MGFRVGVWGLFPGVWNLCLGFRLGVLEFGVEGQSLGFGVLCLGLRVELRVWVLGSRGWGAGFGLGCWVLDFRD